METPSILIKSLVESAEAFGKTTYELTKLKALEATTNIATSLATQFVVILTMSMFVLVFNIGIALLLGELLGKLYYGFFIVATFYGFGWIVFHYSLYKWLKKPVSDLIIKQVLQ